MTSGTKNFLISFITSLIISAIVCFLFFLYGIPFLEKVEVPDVRKATLEQGRFILESKRLFLLVESERGDPSIPEGSIISQNPLPGSLVRRGTAVIVVLSKRETGVSVPNLSSLLLEEARFKLEDMGLKVGNVTEQFSESIAKGSVISTFPPANSIVKEGGIIDLVVSGGKEEVVVPNVLGRRLGEAKDILERVGLKVGKIDYVCDVEKLFDIILRQEPRPGNKVSKGILINLTINVEEEE